VSQEQSTRVAQQLLASIAAGDDPETIAEFFSADVKFEIVGDVGALPWIGRKTGRSAISDFMRDVQGVLADEKHAVIFGELASRVNATGKLIESPFALILDVNAADGKITRFQMLEDTFAVSRAARP
jgi:uncharacterized protein